jgi:hypothetical protein
MSPSILPGWVEVKLATSPVYSDKRRLAQIISGLFGPISYRTIETRPLAWRIHNGKAVTETRAAVVAEWERFEASPEYRTARAKEVA